MTAPFGSRVIDDSKQVVLCALDVRLSEMSIELSKLTDSALFELDEEELHLQLGSAVVCLHLARLVLAKKVRR